MSELAAAVRTELFTGDIFVGKAGEVTPEALDVGWLVSFDELVSR